MKETPDDSVIEARALGRRLRELRNAKELRPEDVRKQLGLSPDAIKSHESGRRGIKRKIVEKYARIYDTTAEYILSGRSLDADEGHKAYAREGAFAPVDFVPVYGPAAGATPERVMFTEEFIVSRDPCPTELQRVKGAFRMYVQGDSMAPRHEPGEKISVNPHQFPLAGQDCIAILEPDGNAILKRYLGSTDKEYKLRQLNPLKDFTLRKSDVRAIYAVVR